MTELTSVLIADDHDIVRDAVAHVVGNELAVPVYTVKDKETALQAIRDHGPISVVLLDISMPGMGTSHSVEEIVKSNAPGAVVIFSGVADEIFVRNAIANGARGFIPKTFPLKSLKQYAEIDCLRSNLRAVFDNGRTRAFRGRAFAVATRNVRSSPSGERTDKQGNRARA